MKLLMKYNNLIILSLKDKKVIESGEYLRFESLDNKIYNSLKDKKTLEINQIK